MPLTEIKMPEFVLIGQLYLSSGLASYNVLKNTDTLEITETERYGVGSYSITFNQNLANRIIQLNTLNEGASPYSSAFSVQGNKIYYNTFYFPVSGIVYVDMIGQLQLYISNYQNF